ncbi:MAG: hypothetical protein J7K75_12895 [Desulfuromonas sp.]|nr:hypothetical protein [Desulfuromonas sp.]
MQRLITMMSVTVLGSAGWYWGSEIGFMTGYFSSCVGSALGLYWGRKINRAFF